MGKSERGWKRFREGWRNLKGDGRDLEKVGGGDLKEDGKDLEKVGEI